MESETQPWVRQTITKQPQSGLNFKKCLLIVNRLAVTSLWDLFFNFFFSGKKKEKPRAALNSHRFF
jgi:hypothetical protein